MDPNEAQINMTGTQATLYEVRQGAAWITLNRPENRNALSAILVNELYAHLQQANQDPQVRSIVITGNGPAFCAGADLKSPPGESIDGGGKAVPYPDVLASILNSEKPVIAAVNGFALGWGMELALMADIRVASETAKFGELFVQRGLC